MKNISGHSVLTLCCIPADYLLNLLQLSVTLLTYWWLFIVCFVVIEQPMYQNQYDLFCQTCKLKNPHFKAFLAVLGWFWREMTQFIMFKHISWESLVSLYSTHSVIGCRISFWKWFVRSPSQFGAKITWNCHSWK